MSQREDVNRFINFALYAVLGRMAEADQLLGAHGGSIHRVAAYLAKKQPIPSVPLYRGMLVDGPEVRADDRYKFVSWTEDRDVANWFASRSSAVSEYVVMCRPRVRGVVLELAVGAPRRLLFHHSWAAGWAELARRHPHMGDEGARQIEWSLGSQREVITAPLEFPPAVEVADRGEDLDRRFAPPWMLI